MFIASMISLAPSPPSLSPPRSRGPAEGPDAEDVGVAEEVAEGGGEMVAEVGAEQRVTKVLQLGEDEVVGVEGGGDGGHSLGLRQALDEGSAEGYFVGEKTFGIAIHV